MIILDKVSTYRAAYGDSNYFFGYYDVSPESPDGARILACRAKFIDHMPSANDELEIGYLDRNVCSEAENFGEKKHIAEDGFSILDTTTSWNFQEGCRLQWLDNYRAIYNSRYMDGEKNRFYITKRIYPNAYPYTEYRGSNHYRNYYQTL